MTGDRAATGLAGGHGNVARGLETHLIVAVIFTKSRLRIRMYIIFCLGKTKGQE